jgi:membrane protein DedA with SNARE-associated domain
MPVYCALEDRALEEFIRHLYNSFGYGGIVLAMAIESCCIPLPSEIIMPLAGAVTVSSVARNLKLDHTFNLLGVSVAGAVGCVIGSIVAYAIGATGGRELLFKYGRYILISRRDFNRAEAFFNKRGEITIFISRLLPVIRTFISLPAGMTRTNFPRFVLFTFLGSLIWCFVLALIGQKLGDHWTDLGSWFRRFDVIIGLAVVVLVVLYVRRHLREGHETTAAA